MVSDGDVALGEVSFCTPSPRPNKRRIESGANAGVRRPFWAPDRGEGSRVDSEEAVKG